MEEILNINGIIYKKVEENNDFKLYDEVQYNGYSWYIIDKKGDNVILLAKECLQDEKMQFNIKNDFDWNNSLIRQKLNKEFVENFDEKHLNMMYTNYDENKYSNDLIRLLTIREVEKLPKEVKECNKDYWTMSPSYFSSWDGGARVWGVYGDGRLNYYWTANTLGVRPVINLKSKYLNK